MFSIVRQKKWIYKKPNSSNVSYLFCQYLFFSLLKAADKFNCELVQNKYLTVDVLNNIDITQNISDISEYISENDQFKPIEIVNITFQTSSSSSSESETEMSGVVQK